jgi:hypothetical protein
VGIFKKIGHAASQAGRFVAAPMLVTTEAVAKGATYAGKKAGIPGAAKADKFMKREFGATLDSYKVHVAVGASVGGAIAGGKLAKIGMGLAQSALASNPKDAPSGETTPGGPPSSSSTSSVAPSPAATAQAPTFIEWLASLFGSRS